MGNCFGKGSETVRPVSTTTATTSTCTGISNTSSISQLYSFGSFASTQQTSGEFSHTSSNGSKNLHNFTYADLRSATKNFGHGGFLGEGGFGSVYKGYIDEKTFAPTKVGNGITVAVKKLNLEGFQGHREWVAEVHFLGALRHPNLVKLIGFCAEDSNRLLVYEYMSRGSLENHLFRKGRNGSGGISWPIRMKIALGAARGVAFLHNAETRVIYRDFKAANILLDDDYNAKLSDFGLAREGPIGDDTHVSTRIMGTYGYAAPEYIATGHLSSRSDVYSFGVVLLELLSGRQAMDDSRPSREQKLVEWAKPYLNDKKKVPRIMDQNLQGHYSLKGAQKVASLALWCLSEDSKSRPTMKKVVEKLEEVVVHCNETPRSYA